MAVTVCVLNHGLPLMPQHERSTRGFLGALRSPRNGFQRLWKGRTGVALWSCPNCSRADASPPVPLQEFFPCLWRAEWCTQGPTLDVHLPTEISALPCLPRGPRSKAAGKSRRGSSPASHTPGGPQSSSPTFAKCVLLEPQFPPLQNGDSNTLLEGVASGPRYMVQCVAWGGGACEGAALLSMSIPYSRDLSRTESSSLCVEAKKCLLSEEFCFGRQAQVWGQSLTPSGMSRLSLQAYFLGLVTTQAFEPSTWTFPGQAFRDSLAQLGCMSRFGSIVSAEQAPSGYE